MNVENKIRSIYPVMRRPYYFFIPKYERTSAGVKSMHLLCHWLNLLGERAFILVWPKSEDSGLSLALLTPSLTQEVFDFHLDLGLSPIVVYPETCLDNYMNADIIVRYFGHYPGHLSPFHRFANNELDFSHCAEVAAKTSHPENIIFIPASNPEIFFPPGDGAIRKGACFYASKYRQFIGDPKMLIPRDCYEITRYHPDDPSSVQIAEIFRRSEVFYAFEDTALINEATMCGCPVILIQNEFCQKPLAISELTLDGIAIGFDLQEFERAKSTVHRSHDHFLKKIHNFPHSVREFIEKTQSHAERSVQMRTLRSPSMIRSDQFRDQQLKKLDLVQERIQCINKNIVDLLRSNQRVIIYGVGVDFQWAMNYTILKFLNKVLYVDRDKTKQGLLIDGISIADPSEIYTANADVVLIVAEKHGKLIAKKINQELILHAIDHLKVVSLFEPMFALLSNKDDNIAGCGNSNEESGVI